MMKGILIGAGAAVGLTAAALGGLGWYFCEKFLKRNEDPFKDDELADENYTKGYGREYEAGVRWNEQAPFEEMTLTARDGAKLIGGFLPAEGEAKRAVLISHGWHSTWQKDFAGIVQYYHEHGAHVLAIEQRGQRRSGGAYITMGVLESGDVAEWAALLAERVGSDIPIYLHGISMGATTVLMAHGETLPANVKGIIADCGFTSPWDISRACLKNWFNLPRYPFMSAIRAMTRLLAGYDMKGKSTLEILRTARIPTLFIHGTKDDFVPPHMTIHNYQVCSAPKRLCLVDDASHAFSWYFDNEKYISALESFFAELEEN